MVVVFLVFFKRTGIDWSGHILFFSANYAIQLEPNKTTVGSAKSAQRDRQADRVTMELLQPVSFNMTAHGTRSEDRR